LLVIRGTAVLGPGRRRFIAVSTNGSDAKGLLATRHPQELLLHLLHHHVFPLVLMRMVLRKLAYMAQQLIYLFMICTIARSASMTLNWNGPIRSRLGVASTSS
jgi:hypothetical protein